MDISTPLNVKIKCLTTDARIPTYGTDGAAAFDFYASTEVLIAPGETAMIPLGVAVEIPVGYVLIVAMRSGIALKTHLRQPNGIGVIDSDYRGEVNMLFTNDTPLDEIEGDYGGPSRTYSVGGECSLRFGYLSDATYLINKGDRVAQGFIMPLPSVTFTEVGELSETDRGAGGFGSTGVSGEVDAA